MKKPNDVTDRRNGLRNPNRLTYLLFFALLFCLPSSLQARVTGNCSNCHTMHNSQGGSNMQTGYASTSGAKASLLRVNGCLGCHATTGSGSTGVGGAPIVYNTSAPGYGNSHDGYNVGLAGGNFYWLTAPSGATHTQRRGHSIPGIPYGDHLTEWPDLGLGEPSSCGNCHKNIAQDCKTCHLPAHHKHGDSTSIVDSEDGYYRFLGPLPASGEHKWGVRGYEDTDWEKAGSNLHHNEYSGEEKTDDGYFSINRFCHGCHVAIDDLGVSYKFRWYTVCLPHSLDSLPFPGSSAPPYGNHDWDGYGTPSTPDPYNLFFPIARSNISKGAYPSDTIFYNTNNVLSCLTCHRAHASPYDKMLRWDNTKEWDKTANDEGCKFCHKTVTDPRPP
jgi:hypothetical protein